YSEYRQQIGGDLGDVHRAHEFAELLLVERHPLNLDSQQRQLHGAALDVPRRGFVAPVHGRLPVHARLVVEAHRERRQDGETRDDEQHRDAVLSAGIRAAPRLLRLYEVCAHCFPRSMRSSIVVTACVWNSIGSPSTSLTTILIRTRSGSRSGCMSTFVVRHSSSHSSWRTSQYLRSNSRTSSMTT